MPRDRGRRPRLQLDSVVRRAPSPEPDAAAAAAEAEAAAAAAAAGPGLSSIAAYQSDSDSDSDDDGGGEGGGAGQDVSEFMREIAELEPPPSSEHRPVAGSAAAEAGGWRECLGTRDGTVYFWNERSRQTTWERPPELMPPVALAAASHAREVGEKLAELSSLVGMLDDARASAMPQRAPTPQQPTPSDDRWRLVAAHAGWLAAEVPARVALQQLQAVLALRCCDWCEGTADDGAFAGALRTLGERTALLDSGLLRQSAVLAAWRCEFDGGGRFAYNSDVDSDGAASAAVRERPLPPLPDLPPPPLPPLPSEPEAAPTDPVSLAQAQVDALLTSAQAQADGSRDDHGAGGSESSVQQAAIAAAATAAAALKAAVAAAAAGKHQPGVSHSSRSKPRQKRAAGSDAATAKAGKAPRLGKGGKMSGLVDKWTAVRKEIAADEAAAAGDTSVENAADGAAALSMEKARKAREQEEWRTQQLREGATESDNANFQPLQFNWRDRVAASRRAAAASGDALPAPSASSSRPSAAAASAPAAESAAEPAPTSAAAPLPGGWKAFWSDEAQAYYYGNLATKQTSWIHPDDDE